MLMLKTTVYLEYCWQASPLKDPNFSFDIFAEGEPSWSNLNWLYTACNCANFHLIYIDKSSILNLFSEFACWERNLDKVTKHYKYPLVITLLKSWVIFLGYVSIQFKLSIDHGRQHVIRMFLTRLLLLRLEELLCL